MIMHEFSCGIKLSVGLLSDFNFWISLSLSEKTERKP